MSSGRTVEPPLAPQGASEATPPSQTDEMVERQLLRDTQDEIRRHVSEIVRLSRGVMPPEEFFAAFLQRVTAALASRAGVVWQVTDAGEGRIVAETQLNSAELNEVVHAPQHQDLIKAAARSAMPTALAPHTTTSDKESGNFHHCGG